MLIFVGLDSVAHDVTVIHAGTRHSDDKRQVLTSGGRVLALVTQQPSLYRAVTTVLQAASGVVRFEGSYFRRDIAHQALKFIKEGQVSTNGRSVSVFI